jgi:hydrogenase/urease accessory protein HupE
LEDGKMRKRASHSFSIGVALILAMIAAPAMAHTSGAVGFWHLVTGADHLLVLVAIALVLRFLVRSIKPVK